MTEKILIIEDDAFLGDILVKKLTDEGYEVKLSCDGRAGLKAMREWTPTLVLLDIALPLMNGYEVLEEKIKDPSISGIPVITVSNSGQPVEINRVLSLGVSDYFVKAQFDLNEVLSKVRMQLGKKEDDVSHLQQGNGRGEDRSLRGKKILWVEDDTFLSDIITRKLSTRGCDVLRASDGEEAEKILETHRPDLILLDVLLPGIDGFEILRRIKARDETRHTPVMLISNLSQKSDIEKGKNLGAARFLIKASVNLDEIVTEIKVVLKETART